MVYKIIITHNGFTRVWGDSTKLSKDNSLNRLYYHRENGPAVEHNNGGKVWWKNDKRIS